MERVRNTQIYLYIALSQDCMSYNGPERQKKKQKNKLYKCSYKTRVKRQVFKERLAYISEEILSNISLSAAKQTRL